MKTQEEVKAESKALIVWFILEIGILLLIGYLFTIYVGNIDVNTFCLAAVFRIVNVFFKAGIKSFLNK